MNAGVSTTPCGVVSSPRRARPSVSMTRNAKEAADIGEEQFTMSAVRVQYALGTHNTTTRRTQRKMHAGSDSRAQSVGKHVYALASRVSSVFIQRRGTPEAAR